MRRILMATALTVALAGAAQAETIGVSIADLNLSFLKLVEKGMNEHVKSLDGVTLDIQDAGGFTTKQMEQVQGFISKKVDAIVIVATDTSLTPKMTELSVQAGIPIVYVNRQPSDVDTLPDTAAFVASNEVDSGTLQMQEVCKLMKGTGSILVMMGELSSFEAQQRTDDIYQVIRGDNCKGISIVDEQSANWKSDDGYDLMNNWLSSGIEADAVVANNDDMALGAIKALKEAGVDMNDMIVAGIDATAPALDAMKAGELDVTVFQNAAAQGAGGLDAALKLAKGEKVERKIWVPFELVTPQNMADYMQKN